MMGGWYPKVLCIVAILVQLKTIFCHGHVPGVVTMSNLPKTYTSPASLHLDAWPLDYLQYSPQPRPYSNYMSKLCTRFTHITKCSNHLTTETNFKVAMTPAATNAANPKAAYIGSALFVQRMCGHAMQNHNKNSLDGPYTVHQTSAFHRALEKVLSASSKTSSTTSSSVTRTYPHLLKQWLIPRTNNIASKPQAPRAQVMESLRRIWNKAIQKGSADATLVALFSPLIRIWLQNHVMLILSIVYIIRFYKILLYLRYLLEWLPQVNPYLQPYSSIYKITDAYMAIFQLLVPPIFGVDLGGFAAWLTLELVDSSLSSIGGIQEASSS